MDLEKGLPEEINLSRPGWMHCQKLDYEHIPFKWKICHDYGHFARDCKKAQIQEKQQKSDQEDQWQT